MTVRADLAETLRGLAGPALLEFLTARSGQPGPRADLELLAAFGDVADDCQVLELVGSPDEYLAACAAAALGRLAADPRPAVAGDALDRMRAAAADSRWRVREGVAMGLQRLGDADPARLRTVVLDWAADREPLGRRAAAAGICEPRLLRDPATARCALEVCRLATAWIESLAAQDRRQVDVRVLRQVLGYCWSVAVAGDPAAGLPAFARLSMSQDPDVRWIVRENRTKTPLARLLER